jgi:hypothetical protein
VLVTAEECSEKDSSGNAARFQSRERGGDKSALGVVRAELLDSDSDDNSIGLEQGNEVR